MIVAEEKNVAVVDAARAILAVLLLSPSFGVSSGEIGGSRPAPAGCEWKPFVSTELSVRLRVADCKDPRARYVFSTVNNRIEQHRPADDRTFGSHAVLEMFSKKSDQTIEDAIETQFIAALDPKARASCKVSKLTKRSPLKGNKQAFTILPTGRYAKEIDADLGKGPRDFGCGPYGADQPTTYFEYHPSESTTRFAFVVYGWDEPLFDENSIEFLK